MKEWRSILMYYCNDRVSFSGDGFSDGSRVPLVDDENGDVGNHCENQDDENDETDENIEMTGNGSNNNIISNNNHHNNNIVPIDKAILFQSTSPTVFNLLQMSMQTGPLVGSNPGYFKRCGGEVAFMAYSFLEEIVELANNNGIGSKNVDGDDNNVHNIGSSLDGEDNGDTTQDEDEHHCKVDEFLDHEEKQNENDGHCNAQGVNTTALDLCDAESNSNAHNDDDDDEDDSSQDSDSHSSQSNSTLETDNNPQSSPPPPPPPPTTTTTHITSTNNSPFNTLLLQSSKILLTNNLQTTFQFTVKQSQTIHQWMQNAQKAVEKNKNPSKSSNKLQSQKSKKQEKKELKRERQLKKKKKKKQK